MLKSTRLLTAIACAAIALPLAAHAQDADVVSSAARLTAAGSAEQAYAMLAPLEADRAGDPDFDFALGLAALESKRFGVAIVALQRVIAQQPGNARAQAELARAYAAAGDIDTARAEFDTVRGDPSIPDPVRQRIDGIVRNLDQAIAGGAAQLTGYVDVEGGYDSNINSATDATSITLPLFAFLGPATLNGAARAQDSGYYQVQAGLSGSQAVNRQTRLFGSVLGNYRDNVGSRFVDQASGVGTVGLSHGLANGDVVSLSVQGQRFWLGGNGYRTSIGGDARYTRRLGADRALVISGQYFRLNYDGNALQDADRYAASIIYADRRVYGGVGVGKEETRRGGAAQLGYAFVNAQLGGEFRLAEKTSLLLGGGIEYRDYNGSDPLFLRARADTQYDGSIGIRYVLSDALSIRPRISYARNESNVGLYDYDRWTASVGIRLGF